MSTLNGRSYHHGELRTALLGAALAVLAPEGAQAAARRAGARRAGVSAMAPYRHYPDKEALLAAVATHGFDGLRDRLRQADAGAAAGQALVAQAVAYVRYAIDKPALFRLMFGLKCLGAHPDVMAAGEAAHGVLAARVAAELPADADRQACTLGCWSMVHGLALLFLDGLADKAAADELTRRVAQAMLLASVGAAA